MIKKLGITSGKYFAGSLVGKLLSTVVILYLAKVLLPLGLGQVSFFIMMLDIITVFGTFGLTQWYLKEVAEHDEKTVFQRAFLTRLNLLGISLLLTGLFLVITKTLSPFLSILLLVGLVSEAFLSIGDGYFLHRQQSARITLKPTTKLAFVLIMALTAVAFHWPVTAEFITITYVLGSMITVAWFFPWHLLRGISPLKLSEFRRIIQHSSPYALLIGTSFFYARGDWFVVKLAIGDFGLGIYSAAYRYLETMSLIPAALSQNLFPLSAQKKRHFL